MAPKPGDVLVSNPTATVAYDVSIVDEALLFTCGKYGDALARAKELAIGRRVDAWFTEDHIHFLNIGSWREEAERV
jgi:hypothetical protein